MKFLLLLFGSLAFTGVGLATLSQAQDVAVDPPEVVHEADEGPAFLGVAVAESAASAALGGEGRPAWGAIVLTVTGVHPGSPAEQAGLQTGDTLLKIDDQQLLHPVQFRRLVAAMPVHSAVALTLRRDGETQILRATLVSRPAELARPTASTPAIPDGFAEMFRMEPWPQNADFEGLEQMQERMREQMRRQIDRMLEAPDFQMPKGWKRPLRGLPDELVPQGRSVQLIDDGEHRLTVTTDAAGRHLKAVAADGTPLFDGPINTPEELEGVPDEIREKLPDVLPTPFSETPAGRAV